MLTPNLHYYFYQRYGTFNHNCSCNQFINSTHYYYGLFYLQQAALVLNASRRFRYTLDLKKEEEKEQIRRKIRAHAQVIRVCVQAFVSAVYVFYHHTLFFFDALVLNSIRLHYCSRKQEKSRMVIRNYQVTAMGSFCCCTHKMLSASWLRSLILPCEDCVKK